MYIYFIISVPFTLGRDRGFPQAAPCECDKTLRGENEEERGGVLQKSATGREQPEAQVCLWFAEPGA